MFSLFIFILNKLYPEDHTNNRLYKRKLIYVFAITSTILVMMNGGLFGLLGLNAY